MSGTRYDLPIIQGEDVDFTLQVWADNAHSVIQNLTGWDTKMQIKDKPGGTTLVTLAVGSGLTINGPAGQVTVHIAGTATATYTWVEGTYDLFVYGPSLVPTKRPLFGDVTVTARVTV